MVASMNHACDYKVVVLECLTLGAAATFAGDAKDDRAGRRLLEDRLAALTLEVQLNQSTHVVKFDVYHTIRPFNRTHGTKVD